MYINTHAPSNMEREICDYFNVSTSDLTILLCEAGISARSDLSFDGVKFDAVIDDFINSHEAKEVIDSLLFFHLTRRLNTAKDDYQGRNLADLLLTRNALSDFLREREIVFEQGKGHLNLFHKKSLVSLEDIDESGVPYLRSRLGYAKDCKDFAFNGFLFKDRLYKNHYARVLSEAPEFIDELTKFLGRADIKSDYYKNSKYYCFEYCLPLSKVLFDTNGKMTLVQKRRYLLNKILYRLYEYTMVDEERVSDDNNLALRLRDDDAMNAEYFIASEIITDKMIW